MSESDQTAIPTSPGVRMYPHCCFDDGPKSPSVGSSDGSTTPCGRIYPNCCFEDGPRSPSATSEDDASTPSSPRSPGSQLLPPIASIPSLSLDVSTTVVANASTIAKKPLTSLPSSRSQATKKAHPPRTIPSSEVLSQVRLSEKELNTIRPGAPHLRAFIKADPKGEMHDTTLKSVRLNDTEITKLGKLRENWKGIKKSRTIHKNLSAETLASANDRHKKLVQKQTDKNQEKLKAK